MKAGVSGVREACGVVAVSGPGARPDEDLVTALHALQHRGQDGAGVAQLAADGTMTLRTGLGRVSDVFPRRSDAGLDDARPALGHVRYATSGAVGTAQVQPLVGACDDGVFALAHNGHVGVFAAGAPGTDQTTDSQRMVAVLAADGLPADPRTPTRMRWVARIARLFADARGAWSIGVLTPAGILAARDPFGIRPLQLGQRDGPTGTAWFVVSESCALDMVGARLVRDVAPGEIVWLGPAGPESLYLHTPASTEGFCSFEYVYFAAASSVIHGHAVKAARVALGRALAQEAPVEADVVLAVPDASDVAARAYADAVALPFVAALRRDPESGRSFIAATPAERTAIAAAKLVLDPEPVRGKRVVVVDDSLVRGTTARRVVALLREAGAAAIHLRIASPPVVRGCHLGVDIPDSKGLFASSGAPGRWAASLGVESLIFLSHFSLLGALANTSGSGFCSGCFGGRYPDLAAAGVPGL